MQEPPWSILEILGIRVSARRAVVFLECGDELNASKMFAKLPEKRDRELRSHFDYWIDGGINDAWFHGWPNHERYKHCFSFRWRERNVRHRIYGFLCHPKNDDPRFQLCVLISHARKTTEDTDLKILDTINRLRNDSKVLNAVKAYIESLNAKRRM